MKNLGWLAFLGFALGCGASTPVRSTTPAASWSLPDVHEYRPEACEALSASACAELPQCAWHYGSADFAPSPGCHLHNTAAFGFCPIGKVAVVHSYDLCRSEDCLAIGASDHLCVELSEHPELEARGLRANLASGPIN